MAAQKENEMSLRKTRMRVGPGGALGDAGNTNTKLWSPGRPGIVRFVAVDYTAAGNAEIDITMKRDSSSGATIYSRGNSNTDLLPTPIGTAAVDEGQAATAATDAMSGGLVFTNGLYLTVAEMDDAAYLDVDVWYDTTRKKTLSTTTDAAGDATLTWTLGRPGVVRAIQVDYSATADAGTDMVIKADTSGGRTLFTKDAAEADFGPSAVGMPGINASGANIAATDGVSGGLPFSSGLYVVVSGGGNTKTNIVYVWYDA